VFGPQPTALHSAEMDGPSRIAHLDLDAFYATVEEIEDPSLRGKPLIVGGDPHGRGVVAAASYAAREFGVRSAMPAATALRLCPQAVFLPTRHELYSEYSRRVMALLREVAPRLEQVSIDEAYLDLSDSEDPERVLRGAQGRIRDELGLSASVGLGTSKLVAKIASDLRKPGGFVVVPAGEEAEFLAPLPIERLWGVGPKTAARLRDLGIETVQQLQAEPLELLSAEFGPRWARELKEHAVGHDDSVVETEHETRSISEERTFARDVRDRRVLWAEIQTLAEGVAERLRAEHLVARTVTLKLRLADFTTLTRAHTLLAPLDDGPTLSWEAGLLMRRAWLPGQPVRLLGVRASGLAAASVYRQAPLFRYPGR
jgi:DNA polymerase IV